MRLGAMLDVPVGSTLRTFMQTSQTLTATLTQTYMCICQKPPTIDNFQLLLSCPTCHSTFTGTFILFVPEAVLYPTMTRSNSSMWMKNATELKGAWRVLHSLCVGTQKPCTCTWCIHIGNRCYLGFCQVQHSISDRLDYNGIHVRNEPRKSAEIGNFDCQQPNLSFPAIIFCSDTTKHITPSRWAVAVPLHRIMSCVGFSKRSSSNGKTREPIRTYVNDMKKAYTLYT